MKKLTILEKVIVTLSILVIVGGGLVIAGMLFLNHTPLEEIDEETNSTVSLSDKVKTPVEYSEKTTNILVLGIADDEEYRESTKMTDVIMVVSMNFETEEVSVLQIPRDTYVGNYTDNYKINAVYKSPSDYTYSGLDGLAELIYDMYQINIDHYVTMQMNGFSDIVDAIGGVQMDVPTRLETGSKNGKIVIEEGEQTLNGEQALAVVRNRHAYINADLGRLDTQKIFLQAFAEKLKTLNLAEIATLIPEVMESCTTDLSYAQILEYYSRLNSIDMENIVAVTIPGTSDMYNGQSVYSPYANQTAYLLNKYFRPNSPDVPAEELQILKTSEYEPELSQEQLDELAMSFDEDEEEGTSEESSNTESTMEE